MKNVIYYNAGAGSGKTYKLTHLLAEKISHGINPSEVILTTFTTKAADDLRSRARAVLYEQGLHEQAALLDQAAIGTVHSLGEKFIGKFWYLLGLSPNMNVMDDDATEHYINRSLAQLPTAADIEMFRQFRRAFNISRYDGFVSRPDPDFWKVWLKEVIDKATWYRVTDMEKSANVSIERLRTIFKPDHNFSHTPDEYYYIFDIVRRLDANSDKKAAKDRIDAVNKFQNLRSWTFSDYADLGKFINKLTQGHKKHIANCDSVVAELLGVWRSYEVFDAMERIVRRIFAIAQQWQEQYYAYKAEHRILDFNDMERYFVQLLQNPACVNEIKGRYKLLMVDEFQDSSPVQVDIFNRLSEMVEQSFWCGDSKQAIYAFRGADTVLTEAVVGMIEDECKDNIKHLGTSYRSEPDIVEQCNSIFCRAFNDVLSPEKVRLNTHREKESAGPSLMHWTSSENNSKYLMAIVPHIQALASQYEIPWKDIAVLARRNYDLATIAEALQSAGIPVNFTTGELSNQKEIEIIKAILTLVVDPNNPLAKAQIVWLTTQGFDVSAMIKDRMAERQEFMRYIQECEQAEDPDKVERPLSWLADNPLIAKILSRRAKWQDQGVASLIETIMVELNLRGMMKSWGGSWQQREDNVYLLCAMAEKYENFCRTMAIGASINGLLNWMKDTDAGCAGDSDGVVLSTYHKSKGLEWKNVILVSLDNDPAKESEVINKGIFGIHELRDSKPSRDNLFPEMFISLLPNIFTGNSSMSDDIVDNIMNSPYYQMARDKAVAEAARLLYVGMTRARDRVITYVRAKKSRPANDNPMVAFTALGIDIAWPDINAVEADIFGTGLNVAINPWPQSDTLEGDGTDGSDSLETASDEAHRPVYMEIDTSDIPVRKYHPRNVSPSKVQSSINAVARVAARSGKRIDLRGKPEMARVGDCIHNTYAAFGKDKERNLRIADSMVKAFDFDQVLPDRKSIVNAYEWLCDCLTEKFGKAIAVHHEVPFLHEVDGHIVRGSIDMVWETAEGAMLIDFKTFPGKESDVTELGGSHYAGMYGAQFECYRNAIEDAGYKVIDSFVYYPVAGLLVQLKLFPR